MPTKIGEIAAQFNISNRTLHYWEDSGLVKSIRMDNGYRYYDDNSIFRIKQILMLRKLRLPIKLIQEIFESDELSYAIKILQKHLSQTRHEVKELQALSIVLEHIIKSVKKQNNIMELLTTIDVSNNTAIREFINALQITLSERDDTVSGYSSYSKVGDVRIVKLPPMVLACYRAESTTPEDDCAEIVNKFIYDNSLHEKNGFRHFGFNNPEPQDNNPVYGYEMWVVIPNNLLVPNPFYRKEYEGGLFAAVPTQLPIIEERWQQLWEWVKNNQKYEIDWNPAADRRLLEECIDYNSFNSSETRVEDKQLDLLAPIKRK